eukprot:Selendium_serpulae@DN4315_c0_g1_i1.p1
MAPPNEVTPLNDVEIGGGKSENEIDSDRGVPPSHRKSTLTSFTINHITMMSGCAVLGTPYAGVLAGPYYAILSVISVGTIAWMSGYTLCQVTELTGACSFEDISKKALKNKAAKMLLSDMSLLLLVSLAGASYTILIANSLKSVLALADIHIPYVAALVLAAIIQLPLCFLKTYSALQPFTTVTIFVIASTFFILIYKVLMYSGPVGFEPVEVTTRGVILGFTTLTAAFHDHFSIPGIHSEVIDRDRKHTGIGLAVGNLVAGCLCVALLMACYMK